jgi:hypothetical protein
MISWLHNRGMNCNVTMRKGSLYKLIVPLKPKEKAFKIVGILLDHGHTAVGCLLICDLNPIELAWAQNKEVK